MHRCVERTYHTDEHGSSEIAEICYCYEFLDDFITPKPTLNGLLSDIFHWNREANKDNKMDKDATTDEIALDYVAPKATPTVQELHRANGESTTLNRLLHGEDEDSWLQKKYNRKNHPLELMVSFK